MANENIVEPATGLLFLSKSRPCSVRCSKRGSAWLDGQPPLTHAAVWPGALNYWSSVVVKNNDRFPWQLLFAGVPASTSPVK